MRVCIRKSDGKMIESQSDSTPGTMIANAISAGYTADQVEERTVTAEEYEALKIQTRPPLDERAATSVDSIDRLHFEISFDMENRMRVREGIGTLTRQQYRTGLINRWKSLNN